VPAAFLPSIPAGIIQFGMKHFRFAILLPLALCACQSASNTGLGPDTFKLPPQSRYSCGNGEAISVTNKGGMVTVTRADGTAIDLPAVEAGSSSRFSAGQVALVFDGSNALMMDTGKPPMECKRG
jgi:membrane-bound inhibitor of C-type lysozyme